MPNLDERRDVKREKTFKKNEIKHTYKRNEGRKEGEEAQKGNEVKDVREGKEAARRREGMAWEGNKAEYVYCVGNSIDMKSKR